MKSPFFQEWFYDGSQIEEPNRAVPASISFSLLPPTDWFDRFISQDWVARARCLMRDFSLLSDILERLVFQTVLSSFSRVLYFLGTITSLERIPPASCFAKEATVSFFQRVFPSQRVSSILPGYDEDKIEQFPPLRSRAEWHILSGNLFSPPSLPTFSSLFPFAGVLVMFPSGCFPFLPS